MSKNKCICRSRSEKNLHNNLEGHDRLRDIPHFHFVQQILSSWNGLNFLFPRLDSFWCLYSISGNSGFSCDAWADGHLKPLWLSLLGLILTALGQLGLLFDSGEQQMNRVWRQERSEKQESHALCPGTTHGSLQVSPLKWQHPVWGMQIFTLSWTHHPSGSYKYGAPIPFPGFCSHFLLCPHCSFCLCVLPLTWVIPSPIITWGPVGRGFLSPLLSPNNLEVNISSSFTAFGLYPQPDT